MAEQTAEQKTTIEQSDSAAKRTRERSTIEFPYGDLEDAIEVAKAINDKFGTKCSRDQLAPALGYSNIQNGAFQTKMATARVFGLIEVEHGDAELTLLGRQIIDTLTEKKARADAFLGVALYSKIYERYKGFQLPKDVGLEQDMVSLGVAAKQKDKARQAFQRSAEQAGLFSMGKDRLVMPSIPQGAETKPLNKPETRSEEGGGTGAGSGNGGGGTDLHPFILGLLQSLPQSGKIASLGARWPEAKRKVWLQTAENIFSMMYSDDGSTD